MNDNSMMELATSKQKLRQMRALIDENLLSPIKFDPDQGNSPDDQFHLKIQPVVAQNSDIEAVLTGPLPRDQRIPMPKTTPGKRDSFSDVIGFPTPEKQVPLPLPQQRPLVSTNVPLAKFKDKLEAKEKIKALLEDQKKLAILPDPIIEDLIKESKNQRSKNIYIDKEELEKERIREAKREAQSIVQDFPSDTNTYGKNPMGLVERLKERKLKGGQRHEEYRRTDENSTTPPVNLVERKPTPPPPDKSTGLSGALAKMTKQELEELQLQQIKVTFQSKRGPGTIRGSQRMGRQK